MVSYWFTADLHLDHSNIIRYCERPQYHVGDYYMSREKKIRWVSESIKLDRLKEMNEMLVENHNSVVKPSDIVFDLGDLFFGLKALEKWVPKLNGRRYLILGNHDDVYRKKLWKSGQFEVVDYFYKLKLNKFKFLLSHRPFARWESNSHTFHLHGHCHGTYKPDYGKILDVGIDAQGEYRPWHLDEVLQYMTTRALYRPPNE